MLGLRTYFDDVVFDPVLPRRADGLTFERHEAEDRLVRYRFAITGDGFSPREVRVNGRPLPGGRYADNPYRHGGLLISKRVLRDALDRDRNLVEVDI